jgi:hypothetical protein
MRPDLTPRASLLTTGSRRSRWWRCTCIACGTVKRLAPPSSARAAPYCGLRSRSLGRFSSSAARPCPSDRTWCAFQCPLPTTPTTPHCPHSRVYLSCPTEAYAAASLMRESEMVSTSHKTDSPRARSASSSASHCYIWCCGSSRGTLTCTACDEHSEAEGSSCTGVELCLTSLIHPSAHSSKRSRFAGSARRACVARSAHRAVGLPRQRIKGGPTRVHCRVTARTSHATCCV